MEEQISNKVLCVIGLGLIGGSLAYQCKENDLFKKVIGVDVNPAHSKKAIELGLVHETKGLEQAVSKADIIALAVPVSEIILLLPQILDLMNDQQIIFDLGSTKESILKVASKHKNGSRFIPAHPMAGTEFSGPEAAFLGLFTDQVCIICNAEHQDLVARKTVETLFGSLDMKLISMNAKEHDMHVAYVSHISHITSFVLATTVLEKEKSTKAIFDLASGGFRSTVRLAKSPPSMWLPIFKENKDNVLEVLDTYLAQMKSFRDAIENGDDEALISSMQQGNEIKKVLGE